MNRRPNHRFPLTFLLGLVLLNHGQAAIVVSGSASFPLGGRVLIGLSAVGSGEINGGSTFTSNGDSFGSAAYVGVDGGNGTLTVTGIGSKLTMATGNAIRIGANAGNSTGTVNVSAGGNITTTNEAFVVGVVRSGSTNNRGTLTINNASVTAGTAASGNRSLYLGLTEGSGTSATGIANLSNGASLTVAGSAFLGMGSSTNSGTINLSGPGNTLTVAGQAYMNNGGGSGRLYVESGNTVSFNQLILQGSDIGSGLPFPSGAGTIDIGITNWATWNPIAVTTSLDLNTAGGSHLLVRSYVPPAPGSLTMGSMIPLITYASRTGSNFDTVGRYFSTANGYGFTIGQNATSAFLLVVPEPSRSLMAGLPLVFLLTRRRRK